MMIACTKDIRLCFATFGRVVKWLSCIFPLKIFRLKHSMCPRQQGVDGLYLYNYQCVPLVRGLDGVSFR